MGEEILKSDDEIQKELRAKYNSIVGPVDSLLQQYSPEEMEEQMEELFANALDGDRIQNTGAVKEQATFYRTIRDFIRKLPK